MDSNNTVTDTRPSKRIQDAIREHAPHIAYDLSSADAWADGAYSDCNYRLCKGALVAVDADDSEERDYHYRGICFHRTDERLWRGRDVVSADTMADALRQIDAQLGMTEARMAAEKAAM